MTMKKMVAPGNPWYCRRRRADGSCFMRKKFACKSKGHNSIVIKKPQAVLGFVDVSAAVESNSISEEKKTPCLFNDYWKEELINLKNRGNLRESMYGSADDYEILAQIGHGAYGTVYKAREKITGEVVAMKEEHEGMCVSSLREIELLKSLKQNPCFVGFKRVVVDEYDTVYVVMEHVEKDLKRAMDAMEQPFTEAEAKPLMLQLLQGLAFLHGKSIMHRDLKPSNLLFDGEGRLKICDFGMARRFERRVGCYSPRVMTLWYRAPELLLGSEEYSCAVDVWSAGCVMAEMLLKKAVFRGRTERKQPKEIYAILGEPDEDVWPGFSSLPGSKCCRWSGRRRPDNVLRENFPMLSEMGVDLLRRLLTYDPEKRITAAEALNHEWFSGISPAC